MRILFKSGFIQDGKLDEHSGRIVIFSDKAFISFNRTTDHNYLLRSFASRFRFNKDDVIHKAIRLYCRYIDKDTLVISEVRVIDKETILQNPRHFAKLILKHLR